MPELKDGKCKCMVCGQMFQLQIAGHYVSRDDGERTFEEQEEEHAET